MNAIQQMLHGANLNAYTRIIVPYACNKDTLYQAWYGTCQINYYTKDQSVTLYNDDNERTCHPIVFLNDKYRNQLIAIFELPSNNDIPRERPFLRVEIVHHYDIKQFSAQGPIFITTELHEPIL